VHLAPGDGEVDPVVRPQRAVRLDDAAELEGRVADRGGLSPVQILIYEAAPVLMLPFFRPWAIWSTLAFWSLVSLESKPW
jgi:hypothetical protein